MKRRKFIQSTAFALALLSTPLTTFANPTTHKNGIYIPDIRLNNGIEMPQLGFGTFTLNNENCVKCVAQAIEVGYRLIDTATIYGNELEVGKGIKKSGINRKKLFITSKLWVDDSGFEETKRAFQTTLEKLQTDYLDLYLIHRPRGDVKGTWLAMEELYKEGKIKAIGISNFTPKQLDELQTYATIQPAINQIEAHPFWHQNEALKDLQKNDIQMESWAPFAEGLNGLFENETLINIGKKYNKSVAQVSLRWHIQRNLITIPRTQQKAHMIENLDIFDFKLSKKDMKKIAQLDLNKTQFPDWN